MFDEAIVMFLVAPGADKGDGAGGVAVPVCDNMVDTFAAVIMVERSEGEGKARGDDLECGESPAAGLVEEGKQGNPAGGGQSEDIPA
ncbi:MAG: hypothetical protein LBG42_02575 [Treponema sp.]|nr:hypothetical protein [Treponema sp.]